MTWLNELAEKLTDMKRDHLRQEPGSEPRPESVDTDGVFEESKESRECDD